MGNANALIGGLVGFQTGTAVGCLLGMGRACATESPPDGFTSIIAPTCPSCEYALAGALAGTIGGASAGALIPVKRDCTPYY